MCSKSRSSRTIRRLLIARVMVQPAWRLDAARCCSRGRPSCVCHCDMTGLTPSYPKRARSFYPQRCARRRRPSPFTTGAWIVLAPQHCHKRPPALSRRDAGRPSSVPRSRRRTHHLVSELATSAVALPRLTGVSQSEQVRGKTDGWMPAALLAAPTLALTATGYPLRIRFLTGGRKCRPRSDA
jgi:hypothetical protein